MTWNDEGLYWYKLIDKMTRMGPSGRWIYETVIGKGDCPIGNCSGPMMKCTLTSTTELRPEIKDKIFYNIISVEGGLKEEICW